LKVQEFLAGSLQSHDATPRQTMSKTLTLPKAPTTPDEPLCDVSVKFVRIKQVRADGLVCFEFAIGWPELFVDLMLPRSAFDDFCLRQKVQLLND
jgi:phenol/toluene 2-monooxygenase (NADH) P0/A0